MWKRFVAMRVVSLFPGPAPAYYETYAQGFAVFEEKHVTSVDRERVDNRCTYCHDPHFLR